jgi:hypothetical protein
LGNLRTRVLAAHQRQAIVHCNGYTSIMRTREDAYPGDLRMTLHVQGASDIAAFSRAREPEFMLPRGARLQVTECAVGAGDRSTEQGY